MEDGRRRLLREVLERISQRTAHGRYRPEKHYMRGPGPKTLAKIGEMLRAQTEEMTNEPLPDQWVDLIARMDERD